MAEHGGARTPRKPAPVSGPGQLSRRTDGGPSLPTTDLPNAGYGENKDFTSIEQGAPMGALAALGAGVASPAPGVPQRPVVGMGEPSQNPNEPVTSGAAKGPGPGVESLGLAQPVQANWQNARDVVASLASNQGASPALQQLAARLKGVF